MARWLVTCGADRLVIVWEARTSRRGRDSAYFTATDGWLGANGKVAATRVLCATEGAGASGASGRGTVCGVGWRRQGRVFVIALHLLLAIHVALWQSWLCVQILKHCKQRMCVCVP